MDRKEEKKATHSNGNYDPSHPSYRQVDLRLALVCYGGVSLATYMYGATLEFYHLLVASRALEEQRAGRIYPKLKLNEVETLYFNILEEMSRYHGVQIRTSIDLIGGTSAGES
jgi:hypothetical protein